MKGYFLKLIRKSQDRKIKNIIKKWLIQIDQKEKLSQNIVALNFNLPWPDRSLGEVKVHFAA